MLKKLFRSETRFLIESAPEGRDAMVLGDAVYAVPGRLLLHIARDDLRMARLIDAVNFFHPEIDCLQFPAWDCLPYDRVSPNSAIVGQRMETLSRLVQPARHVEPSGGGGARLVIATVNAALQRTPSRDFLSGTRLEIARRDRIVLDDLVSFLERNGYIRSSTVTEPGDYAPRGGLIDIFQPGAALPSRIDLFGDRIDSMRAFDPLTQRSGDAIDRLILTMVSEFRLDEDAVTRFREGYREIFGAMAGDDPLYEAVCAGRRYIGMEHWLPLFHERMETLFDYVPGAPVSLDPLLDDARESRLSAIADYYETRCRASRAKGSLDGGYQPMPPERLYLDEGEWTACLASRPGAAITPFNAPESSGTPRFDAGGRPSRGFAAERTDPNINLLDVLRDYINHEREQGRRLVITCYSEGSRDRLAGLLADHDVAEIARPEGWIAARELPANIPALVVLGLEHGFETEALIVLSEPDIFGDRLARQSRRSRRGTDFIAAASHLEIGDIIVHIDHGIGRFDGLETLELGGARHDCLRLLYNGNGKIFLPVENIEMLSRYGSSDAVVQLDRLGGAQWQARKAQLKKRIRKIADELLRTAAARRLRPGEKMIPTEGLYQEFAARFPYSETEDQGRAIDDVLGDLASGRPMDRLVCGDVGFGKTEVALRAAFITAMAGRQVAVVVPTTLLCRQHFSTFKERFEGLPLRIAQLSRLVSDKQAGEVKQGMASGQVDIVIGTHALFAKSVVFRRLGLLVIDEEQHFGVVHKERLKQIRADVHVLTLSATPIPRTMQMALTGVRELSLMATPPVDRLAVRSFIMPYDPVVVREALLREHFRGGQSFFVCPRVSDIAPAAERLAELVPEVKIAVAHGRMAPRAIEDVMNAFYDRAYDVLLSTAIIESGLDIPSANTMIVHRAHMFGLAQLYQLRGRIGRSKLRAYAYFTLPPHGGVSAVATKRLEMLHSLDSLGAGFSLASHDLDIRGAGNLLGSEQSGHIREVGLELFQQMLEEAVHTARAEEEGAAEAPAVEWTPQINLGAAVLIPEDYVADLSVRLTLYRRLGTLESGAEIDAFAAELIDRFGPLPELVGNLIEVMTVKFLCREAGVARVEAGERGVVLFFHDDRFADPAGLVGFIARQPLGTKLRPDHSLLIPGDWEVAEARLKAVRRIITSLAEIAKPGG